MHNQTDNCVTKKLATVMVKNSKFEKYFSNLQDALTFINNHCRGYWTQIYKKIGKKWILAGSEAKINWYKTNNDMVCDPSQFISFPDV